MTNEKRMSFSSGDDFNYCEIEVINNSNEIIIGISDHEGYSSVYIKKGDVIKIRDFLTEWLKSNGP